MSTSCPFQSLMLPTSHAELFAHFQRGAWRRAAANRIDINGVVDLHGAALKRRTDAGDEFRMNRARDTDHAIEV